MLAKPLRQNVSAIMYQKGMRTVVVRRVCVCVCGALTFWFVPSFSVRHPQTHIFRLLLSCRGGWMQSAQMAEKSRAGDGWLRFNGKWRHGEETAQQVVCAVFSWPVHVCSASVWAPSKVQSCFILEKYVMAQVERGPFDDYHASLLWHLSGALQWRRCRKTEPQYQSLCRVRENQAPEQWTVSLLGLPAEAQLRHLNTTHAHVQTLRLTLRKCVFSFLFSVVSISLCSLSDGCRSRGRRAVAAAWIRCHSLYSLLIVPTTEGYLKKILQLSKKYNNDNFPQAETGKKTTVLLPLRADVGKTQSKFK